MFAGVPDVGGIQRGDYLQASGRVLVTLMVFTLMHWTLAFDAVMFDLPAMGESSSSPPYTRACVRTTRAHPCTLTRTHARTRACTRAATHTRKYHSAMSAPPQAFFPHHPKLTRTAPCPHHRKLFSRTTPSFFPAPPQAFFPHHPKSSQVKLTRTFASALTIAALAVLVSVGYKTKTAALALVLLLQVSLTSTLPTLSRLCWQITQCVSSHNAFALHFHHVRPPPASHRHHHTHHLHNHTISTTTTTAATRTTTTTAATTTTTSTTTATTTHISFPHSVTHCLFFFSFSLVFFSFVCSLKISGSTTFTPSTPTLPSTISRSTTFSRQKPWLAGC
jgi:hypothetical protein